jgi:MoxR-like ATPase
LESNVPVQDDDLAAIERLKRAREEITAEVNKVIVGQRAVVEHLLISMLARGHCLLVGVPGLAKTLMISTFARILDLRFNRVQFTPDLMPSDITGTDIIEESPEGGRRRFRFLRGPVFANIVLADEINRAPPKTQSALLQAMQEYQVTAGGNTYPLDPPFFVLATQNPIEQEGTYPLPEAQLDRFMFDLRVDYPSREEEKEIVHSTTSACEPETRTVLGAAEIVALQRLVRKVPVSDDLVSLAVDIVRRTRPVGGNGPGPADDGYHRFIQWGAGPRASQYLVLGAKTRAILAGRTMPGPDDVFAVARPVLRHRIVTNFHAEAEGVSVEEIVGWILEASRNATA